MSEKIKNNITIDMKIINFINNYIDYIQSRLDLEEGLVLSRQLGLFLWANNVEIYSLSELEKYFIEKILDEKLINNDFHYQNKNNVLFIVSEIYTTGGHSRLAENLASFLNPLADLLLTRETNLSIIEREKIFFSEVFYLEKTTSALERITYLLKIIRAYKKVVLLTHPDDIEAIVACGLAKKLNCNLSIHFVNHADHVFSYGALIADVWYEISLYGKNLDRLRNLNAKKSFLGIPVRNKSKAKQECSFNNGDIILTAASANKYKPIKGKAMFLLLDNLLYKYNLSTLKVIGVNRFTNYWWWKLKLKYNKRLQLISPLAIDEYLRQTDQAVLYIDSYPIPGGTAFVEQFYNGRICTGLVSPYQGYSPIERYKKDTIDEVLLFIEQNIRENIDDMINDIHSFDSVKRRFINALFYDNYSDNIIEKYCNWTGDIYFPLSNKLKILPASFNIIDMKSFFFILKNSNKINMMCFIIKKLLLKYFSNRFFK